MFAPTCAGVLPSAGHRQGSLGGRLEVFFTVNFLPLAKTAELSWAVIYKASWNWFLAVWRTLLRR